MSSRDPFWGALKEHKKEKFDTDRKTFMDKAVAEDDGGWIKRRRTTGSVSSPGSCSTTGPAGRSFSTTARFSAATS